MVRDSSYRVSMIREKESFACPDCKMVLFASKYEAHCLDRHGIDIKRMCVWCKKKTWNSGKKKHNCDHLIKCMRRFLHPPTIRPRFPDTQHTFREKTVYGPKNNSVPDVNDDHDDFSIFCPSTDSGSLKVPLPLAELPVTFRDENLNEAGVLVRTFVERTDTHEWFHIMVKPVAYESFRRALIDDNGSTRTIPFSCWCNGGKYREARHRQHRHMIVVSEKGHFDDHFWPKVKILKKEDKPFPHFPCKRSKKIKTPLHLINTLGYLCNLRSRCDFSYNSTGPYKKNHFYLYKTLPKDFLFMLVLLFEGGLMAFLNQIFFQNVSIPEVAEKPMKLHGHQYRQKIKNFYKYEQGIVAPVSKRFMVVTTDQLTTQQQQQQQQFLYLIGGKKLYFRQSTDYEEMDDEDWMETQVKGGNSFYEIVGEEEWVPRRRDQKFLNYYKPVLDENKRLKSENSQLLIKLESEIAKSKRETEKSKLEIASKSKKIEELHEYNRQLNTTIQITQREEIDRLKNEIQELKQEINRLKESVTEQQQQQKQSSTQRNGSQKRQRSR